MASWYMYVLVYVRAGLYTSEFLLFLSFSHIVAPYSKAMLKIPADSFEKKSFLF